MKYFFILTHLFFILYLSSCNSDNPKISNGTILNEVKSMEEFDSFFEIFSKDSVFQKSRIKFPLISRSFSEEGAEILEDSEKEGLVSKNILAKDWHYVSFYYDSTIAKRALDAYKQTYDVKKDKAILMIRGVDNGIYTDFIFLRDNNLWYLSEINDYSN